MAALGVMASTAIIVARPNMSIPDTLIVIGSVFGFLAPTTLSLLSFMKSQETHLSVNSRLDAFMHNARQAAHSQGVSEGRKEGRISADERTDLLASQTSITGVAPDAGISAPIPIVQSPVVVVSPKDHS